MKTLTIKLAVSLFLLSSILSSFGLNSLVFAYFEYSRESHVMPDSAPGWQSGWHRPADSPVSVDLEPPVDSFDESGGSDNLVDTKAFDNGNSVGVGKQLGNESPSKILSAEGEDSDARVKELVLTISDHSKLEEDRTNAVVKLLDFALSGNSMAVRSFSRLYSDPSLGLGGRGAFYGALDNAFHNFKVSSESMENFFLNLLSIIKDEGVDNIDGMDAMFLAVYISLDFKISASTKEKLIPFVLDFVESGLTTNTTLIRAITKDSEVKVSDKDKYRISLLEKKEFFEDLEYSLNKDGMFLVNENYSDDERNILMLASNMYQDVNNNPAVKDAFKLLFKEDFNNRTVFYLILDEAGKMRENASNPAKTIQNLIDAAKISSGLLPEERGYAIGPGMFREAIFQGYGFTSDAAEFIRGHSDITITWNGGDGGGWAVDRKLVILNGTQHEAAVHELTHVWYHSKRVDDTTFKKDFVDAVIKLADMDPALSPDYAQAIALAKTYVCGDAAKWTFSDNFGNPPEESGILNSLWVIFRKLYGSEYFKGMMPEVLDAHNLKEKDWDKINDWEMFAGMASFTMGKFKDGERKLPEFMRKFFSPIFTGSVSAKPYYEK